jgi:hypothetical protein
MHRAPLCNLSSGPLRVMSIQPAWWRYWTSLKNEGLWSEEPIPKIGSGPRSSAIEIVYAWAMSFRAGMLSRDCPLIAMTFVWSKHAI